MNRYWATVQANLTSGVIPHRIGIPGKRLGRQHEAACAALLKPKRLLQSVYLPLQPCKAIIYRYRSILTDATPRPASRTTCSGANRPRAELLPRLRRCRSRVPGGRPARCERDSSPPDTKWGCRVTDRPALLPDVVRLPLGAPTRIEAGGAMELPDVRIAGRARRRRPPRHLARSLRPTWTGACWTR